jgi:hypothetical protein
MPPVVAGKVGGLEGRVVKGCGLEGQVEGQEKQQPTRRARAVGKRKGGRQKGRRVHRWSAVRPGLNTHLSRSSSCTKEQLLWPLLQLQQQPAHRAVHHTRLHTAPRLMRARTRRRQARRSVVLSSAGLDGRLAVSMAWRA